MLIPIPGARSARLRGGLGSILIVALAMTARVAGAEETTKLDCGVNALFVLLRLEGRPATLEDLEAALPRSQHPGGYSMAELSAAAASLGLGLEGVRLAQGDAGLKRPAIAYLKDSQGGHYVAIRPVGNTGTMVQVIDPPHPAIIMDHDRLLASAKWTSRILVPGDPWISRHRVSLLVSLAGILLILPAIAPRFRHASRADS